MLHQLTLVDFINSYGPLIIVTGTFVVVITNIAIQYINHYTMIRIKTFDVIQAWSRDKEIKGVFDEYAKILMKYESPKYADIEFPDRITLVHAVNFYESIAIGITHHALNQEMIKVWWEETYASDRDFLENWIKEHQREKQIPSFGEEYLMLTDKWGLLASSLRKGATSRRQAAG